MESVVCEAHPEHRRAGKRITPLTIILNGQPKGDLLWTWYGELLLTVKALEKLNEGKISGFEAKPVSVRMASGFAPKVALWELCVQGWGGVASIKSGIKLDLEKSCSECGLLIYSAPETVLDVIDISQWDGSDVFMIWPMPKFIFVTRRFVDIIINNKLSGITISSANRLTLVGRELSPGRLAYWMPEERARILGDSLGIV